MNTFSKDKNINFMVFENQNSIDDYLSHEIIKHIKSKRGLNLAIESRTGLFSLMNILREQCINGKVSFSNLNFFMTDDYVFDLNNWNYFLNNSSENIIKNILLKDTDFIPENFRSIIDINRFTNLLNAPLNSYDSLIDAYNGLDILVLKLNSTGSLVFNEYVDSLDLSSKAFNVTTSLRKEITSEFNKNDFLPIACASLGIDQILKTRKIYVMVNGIQCANVLQKMFYTKDYDKTLPACLLKTHPNVVVLADKEASVGIFKPVDTMYNAHYPTTNLAGMSDIARDYASERRYYRDQVAINNQPIPQFQVQNQPVYQPPVINPQPIQQPVQTVQPEPVVSESVVAQPQAEPISQNINIIIEKEKFNGVPLEQTLPDDLNPEVMEQMPIEEEEYEEYDFDSLNDFQEID